MRKFFVLGFVAVLVMAAGVVFAQDDTETTDEAAWLGVAIADETTDEVVQVLITRVLAGSPANAAGLLLGDVVTSYNGEAVTSALQLSELVQAGAPGDTVVVEVRRNEETVTVEVTLGTAPDASLRGRFDDNFALPDGVSFLEMLLIADLEETDDGYTVADVFSLHNPLELQEGDIVTAINGVPAADFDMQAFAQSMQDSPSLSVAVTRNGEEITLEAEAFSRGFGMRGFGLPHHFDGNGFGRGSGRGGAGRPGDNSSTTVPSLPTGDQV